RVRTGHDHHFSGLARLVRLLVGDNLNSLPLAAPPKPVAIRHPDVRTLFEGTIVCCRRRDIGSHGAALLDRDLYFSVAIRVRLAVCRKPLCSSAVAIVPALEYDVKGRLNWLAGVVPRFDVQLCRAADVVDIAGRTGPNAKAAIRSQHVVVSANLAISFIGDSRFDAVSNIAMLLRIKLGCNGDLQLPVRVQRAFVFFRLLAVVVGFAVAGGRPFFVSLGWNIPVVFVDVLAPHVQTVVSPLAMYYPGHLAIRHRLAKVVLCVDGGLDWLTLKNARRLRCDTNLILGLLVFLDGKTTALGVVVPRPNFDVVVAERSVAGNDVLAV